MFHPTQPPLILTAALLVGSLASLANARTIYVDNRVGDDVNNGLSKTNVAIEVGPVRSLERAIRLLGNGDRLEIINNGPTFPYEDSLRLIGASASGIRTVPLIVEGNGAILDGSVAVPEGSWTFLGDDLWSIDPAKKGIYRLYRDDENLIEVATARNDDPNPAPGEWTAWRGKIYYRALPDEVPENAGFRLASREAGIFLYGVRYVIIRNLTVQRYRLDGVNAHDQAGPIRLENITSQANGRSGVFVGGTSKLVIRESTIKDNREGSVLGQEMGRAQVDDSQLDAEPSLLK